MEANNPLSNINRLLYYGRFTAVLKFDLTAKQMAIRNEFERIMTQCPARLSESDLNRYFELGNAKNYFTEFIQEVCGKEDGHNIECIYKRHTAEKDGFILTKITAHAIKLESDWQVLADFVPDEMQPILSDMESKIGRAQFINEHNGFHVFTIESKNVTDKASLIKYKGTVITLGKSPDQRCMPILHQLMSIWLYGLDDNRAEMITEVAHAMNDRLLGCISTFQAIRFPFSNEDKVIMFSVLYRNPELKNIVDIWDEKGLEEAIYDTPTNGRILSDQEAIIFTEPHKYVSEFRKNDSLLDAYIHFLLSCCRFNAV